jgi:breast cancer metastasis-suppressor 1-like protein
MSAVNSNSDQLASAAASNAKTTANDDAESIASDESEDIEVDEDEYERRRSTCLADMKELEYLFGKLKEALIHEKQIVVDQKLKEIEDETAEEFKMPIEKLKQTMDIKTRLATLMRDYKLKNIKNIYEYEEMCLKQSLEVLIFKYHSFSSDNYGF